MKKRTKANRQNPTIKGYLPIRISLPPPTCCKKDGQRSFVSFLYVKEHAQKPGASSPDGGGGATLFVANASADGPIRTDVFLRALFEPYGEVRRVTVAKDPRGGGGSNTLSQSSSSSSSGERADALGAFREAALLAMEEGGAASRRNNKRGDGKFAHVAFASGKEMKKALKSIRRGMTEAADDPFTIRLSDDEMERLETETARLIASENRESDDKDDDDESQDEEERQNHSKPLTGIHAIAAQARRTAGRHISHAKLMAACNDAMTSFEAEEAESERRAKLAAAQPDEDGFITVTHGTGPSFGVANDLEENHGRRKGGKRNRKRKVCGADELTDFYRFQLKETRKKEVVDLKKRFEEDLRKVKRMKEERAYRPF